MVASDLSGSGLDLQVRLRRSADFFLDVAMTVADGETAALLGPNGAGKSTLVAAIAGLLPIDSGRIALGGLLLDDPDERLFIPPSERRIGVVFQDYLLFPHLSVLENVAFGLRSQRVDRDAADQRARTWLERLGLLALETKRPDELSGGQAQRVALARALVTEPLVLLLDEPLAALDVTTRAELRRLLAEHLAAFRGPRVVITHDPTEAFLLADRIYVIEEGVITQLGTAEDIRLRPRTSYAADLAGANLLRGIADGDEVAIGPHIVHIADEAPSGPALVTIPSSAISIHTEHPQGSPRNSWATTIERIEPLGSRVRLLTGPPLPLTVELTAAARDELGLERGSAVWVAIKATEIAVQGDFAGGEAPTALAQDSP